jgi:cobalt-zinc-cadmium efflux system protein
MLAVAAVGLAANLAGMWLLRRPGGSLNLRAALGHVTGDALASLGVLLAGALIAVTGVGRIDLVASIGIAVIIVIGTVRLLTEAIGVLLEGAPRGIDCGEVAEAMRGVTGVAQVHDLHIWSITTGMPALSGHVVLRPEPAPADHDGILRDLKLLLADRFGIHHSTIQVESHAFEEVGELH